MKIAKSKAKPEKTARKAETATRRSRESAGDLKMRAGRLAEALGKLYSEARISLDFSTPLECLAATILSAQCTDERVNRVTPVLFKEIPDVAAMAEAPIEKIQRLIASTGFFRQKAKALQSTARQLVERFGGKLPDTMEELVTLSGVGRKTANVLLGHVFGKPGLVVDTHVRRLSKRLGLTAENDPDKIELALQKLLEPLEWTPFSMRLILHGRRVCFARAPRCDTCTLRPDCPQVGVRL
jgi:endonuclease III